MWGKPCVYANMREGSESTRILCVCDSNSNNGVRSVEERKGREEGGRTRMKQEERGGPRSG